MLNAFFKSTLRMISRSLIVAGLLAGCASTQADLPPELALTAVENAKLGNVEAQRFYEARSNSSVNVYRIGDIVDVEIFNEPKLSGKYSIDTAGSSTFPYIGTIEVAGLTGQQLQERLIDLYGQNYFQNPNILVTMEARALGQVVVDGFVSRPGVLELAEGTSLTEVIARAGGISKEGDSANVFVVRQDGEERTPFRIDLDAVRLAQAPDPILLPSDIVFVKEEGYQFNYDELLRVIPLLNFLIIAEGRI